MEEFVEKVASKNSLANRRPVQGVGINDAVYSVRLINKDGKRSMCPYYKVWSSMLKRCYDKKFHKKQPTYEGCWVCEEWKVFSVFRKWMEEQDWRGKQLDKDLLVFGNKSYNPVVCTFLPNKVNMLITSGKAKGSPMGTWWDRSRGKYQAYCNRLDGTRKNLGRFTSVNVAEAAHCRYKASVLVQASLDESLYIAPHVMRALQDRADRLIARADVCDT